MVLWWIANAVGLAVIIPVVLVLAARVLRPARSRPSGTPMGSSSTGYCLPGTSTPCPNSSPPETSWLRRRPTPASMWQP